jgi:beta-xylosidase
MRAFRLLRFSEDMRKVTDCGDVLRMEMCPWVGRQMWAPDMVQGADGKIYLYYPARDRRDGRFKIGVAVADAPEGPYTPDPEPIPGSYSIDPTALITSSGDAYLYWGGLMGGELQNYPTPQSRYDPDGAVPSRGPAVRCRVAKLSPSMRSFDEGGVREIVILDENAREIRASDQDRLYFEGPFVYEKSHDGRPIYYLLYSTGWTHLIQHATSRDPCGPFRWRGVVLTQPEGWTSQVSVAEYAGKSWLMYHDAKRSGKTHMRDVKFQELRYTSNGRILPMDP